MKTDNKKVGKMGEDIAALFLEKNGYRIIKRNFLTKIGEVDIVSIDKDEYVFVEVKTSKYYQNSSFSPDFRVNKNKLRNIARASEIYRLQNKFRSKQNWRVDVVSVILDEELNATSIEHFKNILFT